MIRYAWMTMNIRQMVEQDWPAVSQILFEGIATGVATFQTEVPTYMQWNSTHLEACRLVAEDDQGRILGWAALSPVSSRAAYRGVAEVSIYVATEHRGRTVGKQLLQELILRSEQAGYWTLQSVILATNGASLALHQSCGFRMVGRRERIGKLPNGTWCDTLLLELRSSSANFLD